MSENKGDDWRTAQPLSNEYLDELWSVSHQRDEIPSFDAQALMLEISRLRARYNDLRAQYGRPEDMNEAQRKLYEETKVRRIEEAREMAKQNIVVAMDSLAQVLTELKGDGLLKCKHCIAFEGGFCHLHPDAVSVAQDHWCTSFQGKF